MTIAARRTSTSRTCGRLRASEFLSRMSSRKTLTGKRERSIISTQWAIRYFEMRLEKAARRSLSKIRRVLLASASGAGHGRDAWDFDHDGFPELYIVNGM